MNSHPTFLFLTYFQLSKMDILPEGRKPGDFESHKNVKLIFTAIWSLRLSFVECKSFLESNSPDILAVCETNLDDPIDSGNFSVRGYLHLISMDSTTHMHGLAVYMKERLPFAWNLSLENSGFLLIFSANFSSLSVLLLFPLLITFFVLIHSFWFCFI